MPPTKSPGRLDPRFDPDAIFSVRYADISVGHFRRMGSDYRIVRPAGTHDWLIILGLSGGGVIRHRETELRLHPGQLVVFKPEMSHDYGTDPRSGHWELIWAHFHPPASWLPLFDWPEPVPGALVLDFRRRTAAARRVREAFHEMYRMATSTLPRRDWLAMNALEGVLLRCDAIVERSRSRLDPRLEAAIEHVEQRLSEPLTLHSLAGLSFLSISQLSALFRKELKLSPQVYIEERRMTQARRLLQFSSLSIKEVAGRVGFNDALYFSKRFRKHAGLTPSEYRARLAKC